MTLRLTAKLKSESFSPHRWISSPRCAAWLYIWCWTRFVLHHGLCW